MRVFTIGSAIEENHSEIIVNKSVRLSLQRGCLMEGGWGGAGERKLLENYVY
jgi:hypothetical protein